MIKEAGRKGNIFGVNGGYLLSEYHYFDFKKSLTTILCITVSIPLSFLKFFISKRLKTKLKIFLDWSTNSWNHIVKKKKIAEYNFLIGFKLEYRSYMTCIYKIFIPIDLKNLHFKHY